MKHTLKKFLAVLLAMLTLFGVTATGAVAESAPGTEKERIPEQAEVIVEDNAVQAAEDSPKKLVAPKTEIAIQIGDYVSVADLLTGTTWELEELDVSAYNLVGAIALDRGEDDGRRIKGLTGAKGGKATLYITAPDGEEVEIKVTVKLSVWNWIKYYLLSGWFFELTGINKLKGFWKYFYGGLTGLFVVVQLLLIIPLTPVFLIVALFKK